MADTYHYFYPSNEDYMRLQHEVPSAGNTLPISSESSSTHINQMPNEATKGHPVRIVNNDRHPLALDDGEDDDSGFRRRRHRSLFAHRFWVWEVAASILSLASIASVIVVLFYEQGKPLQQWQRGLGRQITPTAVVSFLGTIGKSACLVAVTEIISQLKWMHFTAGPRQLRDLQVFDDASRGPWGAFLLIMRKRHTALLALFASVLTLAALLMDPFLQLVFDFPSRLARVEDVRPSIRTSQVYDPFHIDSHLQQCYGPYQVDSVMQAAILSPIWNATRAPSLPCNYESCQWPTITTLGVCSSCVDIEEPIQKNCSVFNGATSYSIHCNLTIPSSNVTLEASFGRSGAGVSDYPYQTLWNSKLNPPSNTSLLAEYLATKASGTQLVDFFFVQLLPDFDWMNAAGLPRADLDHVDWSQFNPVRTKMQCKLDLCARTFTEPYNNNFTAGQLNGTRTALEATPIPSDLEAPGPVLFNMEATSKDHPAMNTTFTINFCDYKDLSDYMDTLFTVEYKTNGVYDYDPDAGGINIQSSIGGILGQSDDIPAVMESIADSMTEAFRTSANSTEVPGVAFATVPYISISWGWLALPVAVVVLTFITLLIVIVRNQARGVPTWKSSSLALLFHELDGWDKSDLTATNPNEVDARAAKMTARLAVKDGWLVFSRDGAWY